MPPPPRYKPSSSFPCFLNIKHSHRKLQRLTLSFCFVMFHSRPQSPRSFWSAPGIETSGRDRSRKSANHGLPAFVRSLRNLNNNGYYRLQKSAAIALARYLVPARGLDPWRRPKGSWALGTRMVMFRLRSRCCSFDFVVKIEVNSIYCDISKVNYKLVH